MWYKRESYTVELDVPKLVNGTNSGAVSWGPLYVDRPDVTQYVGTQSSGVSYRLDVDDPANNITLTLIDPLGKQVDELHHHSGSQVDGLPELAGVVSNLPWHRREGPR